MGESSVPLPSPGLRGPAYDNHRFWLGFSDDWLREVHASRPERQDCPGPRVPLIVAYRDRPDAQLLMAEHLLDLWRQRWGAPPMLVFGYWWDSRCGAVREEWALCTSMALAVMGQRARLEEVPPGADPPPWEDRLTLRTAERYPAWPPAVPGPLDAVRAWLDDRAKPAGRTRTRELHFDYEAWCQARGRTAADEAGFGALLARLGYPSYKSGGTMHRRLSLLPA